MTGALGWRARHLPRQANSGPSPSRIGTSQLPVRVRRLGKAAPRQIKHRPELACGTSGAAEEAGGGGGIEY